MLFLTLSGRLAAGDGPTTSGDSAKAERELLQQIVDAYHESASGAGKAPRFKNIAVEDAQVLLPKFKEALSTMDFSAASQPGMRLRLCVDIAKSILAGNKAAPPAALEDETGPLHLVEELLLKLTAQIDEKWSWLLVSPNVSPPINPSGEPLAAGMKPDAIKNPQARQAYLDRIAENKATGLKNKQQSDLRSARERILSSVALRLARKGQKGLTKEDLLQHFAKDDASKAILEGLWKEAGR